MTHCVFIIIYAAFGRCQGAGRGKVVVELSFNCYSNETKTSAAKKHLSDLSGWQWIMKS
jgi:hypothetical protein